VIAIFIPPLATRAEDVARAILEAARRSGVVHGVGFNLRRAPTIATIREVVRAGRLGSLQHFSGRYFTDYAVSPEVPFTWRYQRSLAGSGALGDIGAHIADLARFLVGEIEEVNGLLTTFVKERPLPAETTGLSASASTQRGQVTVDDASLFLARFANGAVGSFEATRFAPGRRNHNSFEINGSRGSLVFDLERMNELQFFSLDDPPEAQGFRTILVTEPVHPYMSAWWPAGHIIGWEHTFTHSVFDLLDGIAKKQSPAPTFADGVRVQAILDAVERSSEGGGWVRPEY
jgi:predicted dehydrogenase